MLFSQRIEADEMSVALHGTQAMLQKKSASPYYLITDRPSRHRGTESTQAKSFGDGDFMTREFYDP